MEELERTDLINKYYAIASRELSESAVNNVTISKLPIQLQVAFIIPLYISAIDSGLPHFFAMYHKISSSTAKCLRIIGAKESASAVAYAEHIRGRFSLPLWVAESCTPEELEEHIDMGTEDDIAKIGEHIEFMDNVELLLCDYLKKIENQSNDYK